MHTPQMELNIPTINIEKHAEGPEKHPTHFCLIQKYFINPPKRKAEGIKF